MAILARLVAFLALATGGCATEPPPVIMAPAPIEPRCESGAALDVSGFVDDPAVVVAAPRLSQTVVIGGGDDGAYLDPTRRPPPDALAYANPPAEAWGNYGDYPDYVVAWPGWGTGVGRGLHRGWGRGSGAPAGHAMRSGHAMSSGGARGGGARGGGHGHAR